MSFRSRLTALWRNLVHRQQVELELDAELRATFELLVDEKIRAGMHSEEARRAAAIELGGIDVVKAHVREGRAGASVEAFLQDVRYAARSLRSGPLFTLTAVLSLAIGLAGTSVIFSLVDAFLFRARPGVADAIHLLEVARVDSGVGPGAYSGEGFDTFSYPNYIDYRERQTVFAGLAAYRDSVTLGLGSDTGAARVSGGYVSANYFAVLGVPIARGRGFQPEDEQATNPTAVTVISDRLWRSQFRGASDVVGRTVRLNGRPFTIVGVTGPGFSGFTIASQSLWIPLTAYPDGDDLRRLARREQQWLMGIGRLKDGVTVDRARAEMSRIGVDLQREYPDDNGRHGLGVEPSGAVPVVVRPLIMRFLSLLFALMSLILLIAGTNVGGMLLGRSVSRAREIAVRLALGAAKRRIVQLLMVESVLLAAGGAAVGLGGAWGIVRLIQRVIPLLPFDIAFDAAVDSRAIAFSLVVAIVTGMSFGLVTAWAAVRLDLASAVKRDSSGQPRRLRVRQAFVVAQISLSVVLVVCALLLGQSVRHAGEIDPGFVADGVDVIGLDLRLGGYDAQTGPLFAERLMSRVESLPGMEAAASARVVPLTMETEGGHVWLPEEHGDDRAISASWNIVTPGYFRTIAVPLLRGRIFGASDRVGAPAVAVINETLARRAWPTRDAIGQLLVAGSARRPLQVIGVVRDAKYRTIGEGSTPFIYVPAAQRYESIMWLLMRSGGRSMVPEARALLREMDGSLPVIKAAPLSDMTAFTLFPQRLTAWLAAVASTIGLFLAALGVYGVTAYNVSQRTREIGIRVALGAVRAQVLRLVIGHAMLLTAIGTALGLVGAALVTSLLEALLYDIRPLDPVSFAGGTLILVMLALVASVIPARRAASVNPVEALRAE